MFLKYGTDCNLLLNVIYLKFVTTFENNIVSVLFSFVTLKSGYLKYYENSKIQWNSERDPSIPPVFHVTM